jgi:hypothetical protein
MSALRTRQAMCHKSAIGEPDNEETLRVNVRLRFSTAENIRQTRDMIDTLMIEVTADGTGIPKSA